MRTPTALCALCLLAFGCEDSKQGPNPFGTESSTPGTSGADETTSPITTSISSSTNGTTSPPPTTTAPGTTTATTDADSGSGDMTGGSTSTGLALGDGSSSTGGEVQGEVLVQVFLMTEWPTGECNDVHVTNISAAPVTWTVQIDLKGTINQTWNATVMEMDMVGTFVGVDFNAMLQPDEVAMFGFCVDF